MIRVASASLFALVLVGCDRPAPAPRPTDKATAEGFDNSAASQSIMQPKVIAESEPVPTPTPTPSIPTGTTVPFARGVALDAVGRETLDRLLAAPGLPADARWVLRGHSDSSGDDRANLDASRRRAAAVRTYLAAQGIDADRITVIALGERRPVAPNAQLDGSDDPAGRARNRRVEVEILPPEAPEPLPVPTETGNTAG
ncbi:OmpA family protein [Sphingomonas rubra]|uniref:OmpA-OmpF porin, OOP family n=1 Tax=Sphingomonas rubra TaxID=634430 RepID=A0A1I5RRM9_9SPHN|nr:OmpA family protein [Sphingomonas rubra]SFP60586.1 OmpA-OmpF porin, OOP family [Sphingomonas rubra]